MPLLFGKKRRIGAFVLAFLFCTVGFLLTEKGPKIEFNEESWDFGKLKEGEVLTHVFVFKNVGDSPLIINKVRTSCGCTAALVSEKKIEPGQQGEIKATLNTKGYAGDVAKYIYIETNDPSQPMKQLTISAAIDVPPRPKIELDNYSLDLGLILEGEEIQALSNIKNSGELELSVTLAHKDASFFQANKKISSPLKIAAGREADVEIKMPPRNRVGLIREYILMKSNDPLRPNLSLYLSGYIVTKKQLIELFKKYKDIIE